MGKKERAVGLLLQRYISHVSGLESADFSVHLFGLDGNILAAIGGFSLAPDDESYKHEHGTMKSYGYSKSLVDKFK